MRRMFLLAVVLGSVVSASSAMAATKVIVPPGNSGIDQYFETVPGVGGSSGVRHHKQSHNSAVGSSTRQALQKLGANGRGAAAVADATAPTLVRRTSSTGAGGGSAPAPSNPGGTKQHHSKSNRGSGPSRSPASPGPSSTTTSAPSGSSGSPLGELVRAVTAGTKGEGMGALQPIILIGVVLAAAAFVWHRRRRSA